MNKTDKPEKILDLNNTEIAYRYKTTRELKRARVLYRMMAYGWLILLAKSMLNFAIKIGMPVGWVVKPLVFRHFCGGTSLEESFTTIDKLWLYGVGSIPDYSVEGKSSEASFAKVKQEIIKAAARTKEHAAVPFVVFKPTGMGDIKLYEKVAAGVKLSAEEEEQYAALRQRYFEIAGYCHDNNISLFIDAEESWIQKAVDDLVQLLSERYNRKKAIVFNTLQMYRKDRLAFLSKAYERAKEQGYYIGFKLVRGAYFEKEHERAKTLQYPTPLFTKKSETDNAFNEAISCCFERLDTISVCVATHNEESTMLLANLLAGSEISNDDERCSFSQLYGMRDNITFNLAHSGFNVSKYLPYGPVKEVMPYLFRRAEENKAVTSQINNTVALINKEIQRRRKKNVQ